MTTAPRRAGRILLVANYASDVGYAWWLMENFWHVIATRAVADGGTCLLAYPKIGVIPTLIAESPIEIVELPFRHRSWPDLWRGLRFVRRERITAIYLTDWPHIHWIYLLWRLAGVSRIVLHVHTSASEGPSRLRLLPVLKSALHRLRVFSASLYVAVSDYVSHRLRVTRRVPAELCTVVRNGVPLFACDPARRSGVRAGLGIPEDATLIVLVSRATFHKNLGFAVECVARLLRDERQRDRLFAVHCGEGPDLDVFLRQAERAGIAHNFRFLGRRSDVRDILCAADIGFHPSRGEAMSLAILEFMCAGLAVVTSDLPSVSSALDVGVSGETYRNGDLEHATAVLAALADDPGRRQALGRAAIEACRTRFSLEVMNRTFVERVIPGLWQVAAVFQSAGLLALGQMGCSGAL